MFVAKATINFISSMDSTAYFEVEDKRERVLAIKKLKNEFERKYEYKLIH